MHLTRNRKWALGALAFAVIGVALAVKVHTQERRPGDFSGYYAAGRMILEGNADRLYEPTEIDGRITRHFKYLTIFAVAMVPLAALPYPAALWTWKMLHVLAYALGILCSYRIARGDASGRSRWWMLLPIAFTVRLFADNLQLGQINPLVIALALAGVYFFSRRRDLLAGGSVALGAAIKFTPIFFVILFIGRQRWKALGAFFAGLVLFVVIVPSAALGPARNLRLTDRYLSLQGSLVTEPEADRVAGQSLKAVLFRYLTPMNAAHNVGHNDPIFTNLASLDPRTVFFLYAAASLLLVLGASVLATRHAEGEWDGRLEALQASAIAVTMLLVSPESRRAHFLLLVLPFTALTYALLAARVRNVRTVTAGILGLAAALAITLPSRTLVGRELATRIDAYSNMGFAALALLGAIFLASRELRTRTSIAFARVPATSDPVEAADAHALPPAGAEDDAPAVAAPGGLTERSGPG